MKRLGTVTGQMKADGGPWGSRRAKPVSCRSSQPEERVAWPGVKSWLTRSAAVWNRTRDLDAERVELDRARQIAVAAAARRHSTRCSTPSLTTLGTIAAMGDSARPRGPCVSTATAIGATTTGTVTCL